MSAAQYRCEHMNWGIWLKSEHRKGKRALVVMTSSCVGNPWGISERPRGNLVSQSLYGLLHGSEAGRVSEGINALIGRHLGAAMAAGITLDPEIITFKKTVATGKPEVTRFEDETGNVNMLEFVTKEKKSKEEMI